MASSTYTGDYTGAGSEKMAAAGETLKRRASDAREAASETLSEASDKAAELRDKAGEIASDAMERGREIADKLPEMTAGLRREIERSIKEKPLATLAIAAGLAFFAGALFKR